MTTTQLPEFKLETYFARWEFTAPYNLTASDAETLTVGELLGLQDDPEAALAELSGLSLSYLPTWGTPALREAVAATYEQLTADDVLCFAGAQEGMFWALNELVGPGDHAVVTLPCYQSMESVTLATGAEVSALPLWRGSGSALEWTLDLDRLRDLLRPTTALVAVNFPNNPTGFAPDPATFTELVRICDERGIRVFSDEVYRGIEVDPARTLPAAADLSPRGVSLGVMSKAYGLPGLRVGWLATRDVELLARLERRKHYTTISNAGPSEHLATLALRHGPTVLARNRAIVAQNLAVFEAFFADYPGVLDWTPPVGGCVAFPRYAGTAAGTSARTATGTGPADAEEFCRRAVEQAGVIVLPPSLYVSELGEVPGDRFRIGVGRRDPGPALEALRTVLPLPT